MATRGRSLSLAGFGLLVEAVRDRGSNIPMRIIGVSTGTLQLKPTFLEGSPAHGGAFGLIRGIARVAAMLSVLFALYVVLLVRGMRVMIRAR